MERNCSLKTNEKNSFISRIDDIIKENPECISKRICDIMVEVDVQDETYTMHVFREHSIIRPLAGQGAYDALVRDFCDNYCTPEDEKPVLEKMVLERLYRECTRQKEVSFHFYFSKINVWIEVAAFLLHSGERETISMMFSDVTKEQKRAEEDRNNLADALGAVEVANSAKNDFLTKMSHEIKMPVDSLLSMIAFARNNIHHPVQLENYLNKMEDTTKYLLSMVDNIRDITNLESGRLVIAKESFDLMQTISDLSYQVGKSAKSKLIHFEVEEYGELIQDYNVIGDKLHLMQILENVLLNALKYTPSGGTVSFSYEEQAEEDGRIQMVFTVKDNGIGISRERLEHIFEIYPSEKERKWVGEGTGLGLAISYRLVHLMNGDIQVESEEAKGSCFKIYVPFEKGVRKEVKIESQKMESLEKKILIAEANLLDCETIVTYLELNGYKVVRATHGADVVKKFKQAEEGYYQAIILAENLPIQNGASAASEIRKIGTPEADRIPIILTVKKLLGANHELFKNRIISFELEKPIDADRLLGVLEQSQGTW